MGKKFFVILLCAFNSLFVFADSWLEKPDYDFYSHPLLEVSKAGDNFAVGKILKIVKTEEQKEKLSVKIVYGAARKQIVEATNYREGSFINPRPGQWILVSYTDNMNEAVVVDYDRSLPLVVLLFLFSLLVLLVGGLKKLGGLFTLFLGMMLMIFVYGSLIIYGYSPVIVSLFVIFFTTLLTNFFIGQFSKKSIAATVGTLLSIVVVLGLGVIFYSLANINGFSLEPVQMLNYFSKNYSSQPFNNFRQLLLSILILGASGVIIDVAVCIASSMEEIVSKRIDISRKELVRYGMNTGRNIVAIASNTLVLAYFGASLILILATTISIHSLTYLFNSEWFFLVVFQAFAGSIGFLLAVPFTAIAAGYLMVNSRNPSSL